MLHNRNGRRARARGSRTLLGNALEAGHHLLASDLNAVGKR